VGLITAARSNARELSETTEGWPIERTVSLLAGTTTLVTLGLGRRVDPRWRILTSLVGANLVLQSTVGWCPASVGMRMLGMRECARTESPTPAEATTAVSSFA
jgi:hypothetical protein